MPLRPDPRQIRDPRACPTLEAILADEAEDAMVRHECAEALGVIGAPRSVARPSSRFGPPETVSGPRDILCTQNPYGKFSWGPG